MLKSLLAAHPGRIYIYLHNEEVCRQFFREAETEGFTFSDGTKPTEKHVSDLIALNPDATMHYVGFVGHMAFQTAKEIGGQPLHKIDYRQLLHREAEC